MGKQRLSKAEVLIDYQRLIGSNPYTFKWWDKTTNTETTKGTVRTRGTNLIPTRLELLWIAGLNGLPQLNAVTDPPGANTYDTAGMTALLIADRDFELLGTNASSDDVTLHPEGGIKFETDGAANDQVILLPHLNASQTPWTGFTWGTDQETEWECLLATGSAITATAIWAGLKITNTSVTTTDIDQAFFRYEAGTNSGKWQAIASIDNVDSVTDSGVTAAVSTKYHLKIMIDSTRVARFFINGVLVKTSAALKDAVDLIPYIGLQGTAGPGAAKHMYVFAQAISRNLA